MTLRKYRFGDQINDDLAVIDQLFDQFSVWPFRSSTTRGTFINTDDYDITPKKSTVERKIKETEQRLTELKDRRTNHNRTWDEQEKQLQDEIYDLKKKLSP